MTKKLIRPPTPETNPTRVNATPFTVALSNVDGPPRADKLQYPNTRLSRSDLKLEGFQRLLAQHGKKVTWRKAIVCPCLNQNTGNTRLDCAICGGQDYFYVDPILTVALVLNSDLKMSAHEKFGMWQRGEAQITIDASNRLSYHDTIELRDDLMTFSEVVIKGSHRGYRSKLPANADSGRYRIVNMVHAMKLVTTPGSNTGGSFTPDVQSVVSLTRGVHFDIDANGWIVWTSEGNSAVKTGDAVTIRYDMHPVYVIDSMPHASRSDIQGTGVPQDTVRAYPLQALGRLDYLLDVNKPRQ